MFATKQIAISSALLLHCFSLGFVRRICSYFREQDGLINVGKGDGLGKQF